jgi:hypothetical protein
LAIFGWVLAPTGSVEPVQCQPARLTFPLCHDVVAMLDALEIAGPVGVMGWSVGSDARAPARSEGGDRPAAQHHLPLGEPSLQLIAAVESHAGGPDPRFSVAEPDRTAEPTVGPTP